MGSGCYSTYENTAGFVEQFLYVGVSIDTTAVCVCVCVCVCHSVKQGCASLNVTDNVRHLLASASPIRLRSIFLMRSNCLEE